ncbi:MAG: response regulator [Deltaproteobacteria bacterium]|nr:response regulator [Deltaproteobacteria bacterium]
MDRKFKILIVDDEKEILSTYKDFFTKRGFIVDTAHNGLEGLEKLQKDEFDVAIVDIKMPKMNGTEMIEEAIKKGIDTEMIILTGHGGKDDAIRLINMGGVKAWFEKHNIKMNKLLDKVTEAIEVISLDEMRKILSSIPDVKLRKE